jgi:hypothetical protein
LPRRFLDSALTALDNAVMDGPRFHSRTIPIRRAPRDPRALGVFLWVVGVAIIAPCGGLARGADIVPTSRVIERIPRTSKELDVAHEKSNDACVLLPAGEPLTPARFESDLKSGELKLAGGATGVGVLPPDSGRWPALSFGVTMNKDDKADLPRLSRRMILDKISSNYVCLQVRVERAPAGGAPFLHYQPIAAVGAYGHTERTEKFASLQQTAVANVRSLGLFVKPGEARQADNLRTLILTTKGKRVVAGDTSNPPQLEPSLEMIFVRLRIAPAKAGSTAPPAVEIHTFSTTDDLKRLVYVDPYTAPERFDACGMTSTIRLTEFAYGGHYPSARATRGLKFQSRGHFEMAELDAYARDAHLKGGALDHLTDVLDAVIDGRLKPRAE